MEFLSSGVRRTCCHARPAPARRRGCRRLRGASRARTRASPGANVAHLGDRVQGRHNGTEGTMSTTDGTEILVGTALTGENRSVGHSLLNGG